jgi:hypothetical protein
MTGDGRDGDASKNKLQEMKTMGRLEEEKM